VSRDVSYNLNSVDHRTTIAFPTATVSISYCTPFTPSSSSSSSPLWPANVYVDDLHGNSYNMGYSLNFVPVTQKKRLALNLTFSLVYTDTFDVSHHPPGCLVTRTTIFMFCALPEDSTPFPQLGSFSGCELILDWRTQLGCRTCVFPNDFERTDGHCDPTGKKIVYQTKKLNCLGQDVPPEIVSCSNIEIDQNIGIIFFGVVASVIVVGLIVCIIFAVQHRRLTQDYEALQVSANDVGPTRDPNKTVELEDYSEDQRKPTSEKRGKKTKESTESSSTSSIEDGEESSTSGVKLSE